ncbi:MAG: pyruvate, phosphate dikinase [Dehalococcoidia bacterium]|nr:pyruvate, phosphate dikinase [Dehalococcoidia bacterium]
MPRRRVTRPRHGERREAIVTTASQPYRVTTLSGKQLVFRFGDGRADGDATMRDLLGGKGSGLAEMSSLGVPVPPGFTITTEVCNAFYALGRSYQKSGPDWYRYWRQERLRWYHALRLRRQHLRLRDAEAAEQPQLEAQVRAGVDHIERLAGARFGDPDNPLLVSVRSGARASMPGMMDTVLNLGLNDVTVEGLARRSGNPRFAWDSYRRFVAMYGDVVLGMKRDGDSDEDPFEALLDAKKRARGVAIDTALDAGDLRALVDEYRAAIHRALGIEFPQDPWEQLWGAIGAVFNSWENPRAVIYRDLHGYPSSWGTAVTVQAMVFGNLGDDCATGVVFTRDAATGARRLSGEFLVNAQGEDVVAGTRTPQPILAADRQPGAPPALEQAMPTVFADLQRACATLEAHFHDMQDVEFTAQQGRLWILQTRNGKRTGRAMVTIAVDLVAERLIDERTALLRQDPEQLQDLFHQVIDPATARDVIAKGLAASPGAAVGRAVFSATEAAEWVSRHEPVILVRTETSPEDIQGMIAAQGILTARGGLTSHAAVVARGWGKCCITGCGALQVDYRNGRCTVRTADDRTVVISRGDWLSIDGSSGEVMLGRLPLLDAQPPPEYHRLMAWADRARQLRVRANADTPRDAQLAREFGAEGIGLCRTEHMFFGEERILAVRQMICAEDGAGRHAALAKILPMQREDFAGILRAMAGYPVTIRLLDPPLHEFLPGTDAEIAEVARALVLPVERVRQRVEALHEFNPMLGHRGVRLAITFPEIYETQVRAIMEAACRLAAEGVDVRPEIMVPLVATEEELRRVRELVAGVAERVIEQTGTRVAYTVGTMIELPRACVVADRIAEHADFFSFGTNDLTQTTFGLSRDDAGRFLPSYLEQRVLERDPFVAIDREGVGGLMRLAIERGRSTKPRLKIGICGEHGGNPESVEFCHQSGLDYVSCSPYRVPIARLAAAQAALRAYASGSAPAPIPD